MKLLLHMCCGPCSTYPAGMLQEENISFEGLFYNPNIHPREEFDRRRENVEKFAQEKNIPLHIMDDFRQKEWESFAGNDAQRCAMCYALRMDRAAAAAKEMGFNAFSTTLLVSPYQKHDIIRELGENAARKHGVDFYYRDFRPGFRHGQQQAREMGLYRQKYCGCIVSFQESAINK